WRDSDVATIVVAPEDLSGVMCCFHHVRPSSSSTSINCLAWYVGILPSPRSWKLRTKGNPGFEKNLCRPLPPCSSKPAHRAILQASSTRTSFGLFKSPRISLPCCAIVVILHAVSPH